MTMLEDDLREMFEARVRNSPATLDPAGTAIRRGRRRRRWNRTAVVGIATAICAVMLGGIASMKGLWGAVPGGLPDEVTYDALYGRPEQPPQAAEALPIIAMPVDVHVGTSLWTTDGERRTLPGVQEVIEVIRVPQGWLYSDDFRLNLLTLSGQYVSLRDNVASWMVSGDGAKVATVYDGASMEIHPAVGGNGSVSAVPAGTRAVGFDADRAVLARDGYGSDHWSGTTPYQEAWHQDLLAVYGARDGDAVGLVSGDSTGTCLVEVRARQTGWLTDANLGCGDLLATAARDPYGKSRAARSPDGRWLAVPSQSGVHLIDIQAARAALASGGADATRALIVARTCLSIPDAPAVWADSGTVLTIGANNGVIACGINGSRNAVQLPSGVSDGWELVRRYGVTS